MARQKMTTLQSVEALCRLPRPRKRVVEDAERETGSSDALARSGRPQWKKESGYHQQTRAENTFFRFKAILGDRLRARDADAQSVEARLACNILNRTTELGMSASYAVGS